MKDETAFIVETAEHAALLRKYLPEGSSAYGIGQGRIGARYRRIVFLCRVPNYESCVERENYKDWWGSFRCCLRPDGIIIG